jgi:nucleoside-diphosphate-sugar epimerase
VKDTAAGFIAIAESEQTIGKEVNIASNFEISMKDTLMLIKSIMNSDVEFIIDEERIRPGKSEVFRLWGDNKLIKEYTGFQTKYSIEQGLQETIEWFLRKENLSKFKSTIYNV